jgi:CubicO group peptidase (beta-lactamase class C family)
MAVPDFHRAEFNPAPPLLSTIARHTLARHSGVLVIGSFRQPPTPGVIVTASVPLPRSTPEEQGIPSSAIAAFVDAADALDSVNSFMLTRHGHVVAEGWWCPYAEDVPHMMFSVSKSFTSIAVGLVIEAGLLTLDSRVVDLLPEDVPSGLPTNAADRLGTLSVRNLLTMATGHAADTVDLAAGVMAPANWARAILAAPLEFEPGEKFVYNSGATYLLAAIVTKVTRERLLDYLTPRLLEPLGIRDATWEQSPQGIDAGGWGLSITTEELAIFGQLLLQRGEWNGVQLVPAAWIDESTAWQIDTSGSENENPDWAAGYGYQYWRNTAGGYRADGAFGNFAIVLPELDAVVTFTSSLAETQPLLDLVWEHILPALTPEPLAADPTTAEALRIRLRRLELWTPNGVSTTPAADRIDGARWVFDGTDPSELAITGNTIVGTWHGNLQTLAFGDGDWEISEAESVAASGAWTAQDQLTIRISYFTAPYAETLVLTFGQDTLDLVVTQNVSFADNAPTHVTGRREASKLDAG